MGEAGLKPEEHVLFTQPGMRYCQAQALVHSLLKDETFLALEAEKRAMVCERILEEVRVWRTAVIPTAPCRSRGRTRRELS